jgi:uncharacterized membrane-anchored protein YitT (DUF2179 family)
MKNKALKTAFDLLVVTVGGSLFALAVSLFLAPNQIVPGGITGASILITRFLPGVGVGTLVILLNLPLFAFAFFKLGRGFLLYSAYGTFIASVMIDLVAHFAPPIDTEPLMAALAGGVLEGLGLGLVFTRGATTGGSDIIARLLKLPFPTMRMGRLMLAVDGMVVMASMLVFGHINPGLHAILAIFVSSRTVDALLYGLDIERAAYIISERCEDIADAINKRLERGATLLNGRGAYTGHERTIILCAVKRQQVAVLKRLVKDIDPRAFIILMAAHEVLGEGFKYYDEKKF